MRLGDLDALKKVLDEYNEFAVFDCDAVKDIIDNAPTVEPKKEIVPVCKVTFDKEQLQEIVDKKVAEMIERPQGEWVIDNWGIYHCNHCMKEKQQLFNNFCGNCGASMKKGGKG